MKVCYDPYAAVWLVLVDEETIVWSESLHTYAKKGGSPENAAAAASPFPSTPVVAPALAVAVEGQEETPSSVEEGTGSTYDAPESSYEPRRTVTLGLPTCLRARRTIHNSSRVPLRPLLLP